VVDTNNASTLRFVYLSMVLSGLGLYANTLICHILAVNDYFRVTLYLLNLNFIEKKANPREGVQDK